jgi:hypothetical protein
LKINYKEVGPNIILGPSHFPSYIPVTISNRKILKILSTAYPTSIKGCNESVTARLMNRFSGIFDFFNKNMDAFERFFYENEDYIKDLEINT